MERQLFLRDCYLILEYPRLERKIAFASPISKISDNISFDEFLPGIAV